MAYTLNTGHALYGNLIELIGVQAGALVSHKTARTFTKNAAAAYGSGTLGEHLRTGSADWAATGASFTPAITINETSTTPNHSIFIVVNNIGSSGPGSYNPLTNAVTISSYSTSVGVKNGNVMASAGYDSVGVSSATNVVANGAHSLCVTKTSESAHELIIDGVSRGTGGKLAWNSSGNTFDYIGGASGQGVCGNIDFVWIAVFDKVLSAAEALDLHNSIAAGNVFGLVGSGTPSLVVSDGSHAHAADNLALTIIGTLTIADATHAHAADSITLTATSNGTIIIPAVRDWGTKALKTGQTGVQVDIRNITTGALVVRKTGQTTHATTGVCVVTDAAIVAGTTYEVVTRFADGSRGMWDYTAS